MSIEAENDLKVIRANMQMLNGRFDALALFFGVVLHALAQEGQRDEIRKKLEMLVAPVPDLPDLNEDPVENKAYNLQLKRILSCFR